MTNDNHQLICGHVNSNGHLFGSELPMSTKTETFQTIIDVVLVSCELCDIAKAVLASANVSIIDEIDIAVDIPRFIFDTVRERMCSRYQS